MNKVRDLYDYIKLFLDKHTALIAILGVIGYAGADTFIKPSTEPLTKSEVRDICISTINSEYIDEILSP